MISIRKRATGAAHRSDGAASLVRTITLLAPLWLFYLLITFLSPHPDSDEGAYVQFAENLSEGFYSPRGADLDLWFGPGLPLLLAPFAAVDAPLWAMRLVGPLALSFAVTLFYVLLRMTVTPRAALIGALALGLYWPAFRLLPTLHSELPAMAYVVAFMIFFTLDLRRPRATTLLAAAASLALLAVTRVVFGWVLVAVIALALAIVLVRKSPQCRRLALVSMLGLALASPWLLYTYDVTGKVFYWSTSGGLSLYWMASPYPGDLGDWHASRDVMTDEGLAPHRPFVQRLRRLEDDVERDEALRSEAIDLMREHPQAYLRNLAANVSRLWFSTPFSRTPQKLSTTFYIVPNALLLAGLAAAVFIAALFGSRRRAAGSFAVFLVAGVGVQALLASYARMLTPLVPVMLWFIVQAIAELGARFNERAGRTAWNARTELASRAGKGASRSAVRSVPRYGLDAAGVLQEAVQQALNGLRRHPSLRLRSVSFPSLRHPL